MVTVEVWLREAITKVIVEVWPSEASLSLKAIVLVWLRKYRLS